MDNAQPYDLARIENFDVHYETVPRIFKNRVESLIGNGSSDMTLLDFGCNYGIKTLGISSVMSFKEVIGCDINENFTLLQGIVQSHDNNIEIPTNLSFFRIRPGQSIAGRVRANIVFSWSVFEHVDRKIVETVLRDLYCSMRPNGIFFLQINPLFYSPYGSHICKIVGGPPWVHLLLSN